jgi:hypothetical protein
VLLKGGIYAHQTAEIEEEVEGDDGEVTVKRNTTGGDPDLFKFFLERAWQLSQESGTVGLVMSNSIHLAQGATGLRRLLLEQNRLRLLCNFDNERKLFPGIDNRQDFDLIVFDKGGTTETFDVAFLTRETEHAIQSFRSHPNCMRLEPADVRRLSPQTLTFFEFRGRRDLDIVRKAYRLHPPFGQGLMPKLGLKYRREFDMGNSTFLFRDRAWLRRHGCTQEPGETWRAAGADWYEHRGYIDRPVVVWYAVFDGDKPVDYRVPWPIAKGKTLRRSDLDDFKIRLDLPGGLRLYGQGPDDDGAAIVFVSSDEAGPIDAPVYVPGRKFLGDLAVSPCLRPGDVFLPLMEGKWVYQHKFNKYAFVHGSGSWVVTRPLTPEETDLTPHYFLTRLDAITRTPRSSKAKIGFRDVSSASNERSYILSVMPAQNPCGDKLPTLVSERNSDDGLFLCAGLMKSFALDYVVRLITSGKQSLTLVKQLPVPNCNDHGVVEGSRRLASGKPDEAIEFVRATLDALAAALFELTPAEYAYILSTFPLLDRDQPPLPGDHRVRATNKGIDRRKQSFVTRDLALLTYFDYLAGHLEVKPDPARASRICPGGVPEPPTNIVAFFAEAGVDIAGASDRAVAETGPVRDLRARVVLARELDAVAYVPTIDRRRASFVERAAAAGGLDPADGVLTPEMSRRVLRDKAERDARWQRAMALWQESEALPRAHYSAVSPSIAATTPKM